MMRIMRLLRLSGDPPVPPLTSSNHPRPRSHSHLALLLCSQLWWVLGSLLQQHSGWSRELREQIECRRCCHCSPTARQTPHHWHPGTSFHISPRRFRDAPTCCAIWMCYVELHELGRETNFMLHRSILNITWANCISCRECKFFYFFSFFSSNVSMNICQF